MVCVLIEGNKNTNNCNKGASHMFSFPYNLNEVECVPQQTGGAEGLTLTGMDTMMVGWWVGVGNSHLVKMH